ncbi:hypothetical protein D3C73_984330 [compost metagenome]
MEGDGVQLACLGVCPRLGGADLCRKLIQDGHELVHLGLGGLVHREGVTGVLGALAVCADVDGFTVTVARVHFQAELVQQLHEDRLVRGNPLAADLQHGTVDGVRPCAAAHAVACFEHCDAESGLFQFACGRQP